MRHCMPDGKQKFHVNIEDGIDLKVIERLNSFDWKALYTIPDSLQEKVDHILNELPDHITDSKSNARTRQLQKCKRMINNSKQRTGLSE